jgi:cysteine-S-conjugate beta-lyase
MKTYNFDEIIDRRGTNSVKYDMLGKIFGNADALPLWVADTDFRVPDFITEALRSRMDHEILAYTFKPESYYASIINWMDQRYGWKIDREMISSSPGVVSGVTMLIMALSEPGDKVIVQPPVYFPFFSIVKGSDRKIVENPLILKDGRYCFDFENLEKSIDGNTKLLILCSPHNPGGMVWKSEELKELGSICLKNGITIISDEIHSDLVFKGYRHTPLPLISDELANNCAVCMAPSKTFNIAGLSTAMVIIPNKNLRIKYKKVVHTLHIEGGNIFGNIATEAAYQHGAEWLTQLMDYLDGNYRFLESYISENLPLIKIMKPESTFLVWLDLNAYGLSESEMAKILVYNAGVALNPGSRFGTGGEGFFRLNFGCPRSVLEEGLVKIAKALSRIDKKPSVI